MNLQEFRGYDWSDVDAFSRPKCWPKGSVSTKELDKVCELADRAEFSFRLTWSMGELFFSWKDQQKELLRRIHRRHQDYAWESAVKALAVLKYKANVSLSKTVNLLDRSPEFSKYTIEYMTVLEEKRVLLNEMGKDNIPTLYKANLLGEGAIK